MKVLQLIILPILIVVTLYGTFSQYLTEFWRGLVLGVLIVLLPMSIINIYLTRKGKGNTQNKQKQPTEREMTSKITPQQQIVVPPPKGEILRVLRDFTSRWEQFKQLDHVQRWVIQDDLQKFSKQASSRLLVLVTKYVESWDFALQNQAQTISNDLQKLALMLVSAIGPGTALMDMEKQGDEAYQRVKALVSFLTEKDTTR